MPNSLSLQTLARMQRSSQSFGAVTVEHLKKFVLDQEDGGKKDDWRVIHTYPDGRLAASSNQVSGTVRDGTPTVRGDVARSEWQITLPYDAPIPGSNDRLRVGADIYEIVGTNAGRPDRVRLDVRCYRLEK